MKKLLTMFISIVVCVFLSACGMKADESSEQYITMLESQIKELEAELQSKEVDEADVPSMEQTGTYDSPVFYTESTFSSYSSSDTNLLASSSDISPFWKEYYKWEDFFDSVYGDGVLSYYRDDSMTIVVTYDGVDIYKDMISPYKSWRIGGVYEGSYLHRFRGAGRDFCVVLKDSIMRIPLNSEPKTFLDSIVSYNDMDGNIVIYQLENGTLSYYAEYIHTEDQSYTVAKDVIDVDTQCTGLCWDNAIIFQKTDGKTYFYNPWDKDYGDRYNWEYLLSGDESVIHCLGTESPKHYGDWVSSHILVHDSITKAFRDLLTEFAESSF